MNYENAANFLETKIVSILCGKPTIAGLLGDTNITVRQISLKSKNLI